MSDHETRGPTRDAHGCPAHTGGPSALPGGPQVLIGGLPAVHLANMAICAGPRRTHWRVVYPPSRKDYASVLMHLGRMKSGEQKHVLPWDD